MGAAPAESPLSPKSAPNAICANLSSIECRMSDGRLYNGLGDAMKTVLVRVLRLSISMTALNPLNTILTTFHEPVNFSCTNFGPIPCRKRELSFSRARTRSSSTDPSPDDGRRISMLRRCLVFTLLSFGSSSAPPQTLSRCVDDSR